MTNHRGGRVQSELTAGTDFTGAAIAHRKMTSLDRRALRASVQNRLHASSDGEEESSVGRLSYVQYRRGVLCARLHNSQEQKKKRRRRQCIIKGLALQVRRG
jgi:hypothetical protein